MGIEFGILGPLRVLVQARPVSLGGRKQRALLGVLLVHPNASVSTERLVDEVWGDSPPAAPARNVQVYVSALRTTFGPEAGVLQTTSDGYRLLVTEGQLDARRFERAGHDVKVLLARGDAAKAAEVAAGALAAWRGPVFGDLADFPFARTEVARLEALHAEVVDDRLEAELDLGHHHQVVAELESLVARDPLRERSRCQLMLALHRCGRQADALAAYREGRRQLIDELGLEPGKELRDLHQAVLRDDPGLLVEPAELRMRRHLPAPATPLIGRRAEIEQVTAKLRDPGVRLVTATGPGGIGKTRLALQSAHELADAFPDGVFFVGLAELRDPDLVIPTLADVLDVEEVPEEPLSATLLADLKDRRLLLLLDNFEHVDEAAPLVGQLLSGGGGLKVLATSRARLRLYGEHEYPVPQLALLEEAVPLFEARARAADPRFCLSGRLVAAVREICARLDCLPLAIELAAARVTEFSPEEMLSVLPRRLDLAAAGPRDLAARQQTLRAAIDWSYRLLCTDEQNVFTGLAVFVGGCDHEAAAAVCGATPEVLASLTAKSLVFGAQTETNVVRVDMLQTIRDYGLERLDDGPRGDGNDARHKHARYFLELAEAAVDELRGPNQLDWIGRLETERDNIRAALAYLLGKPDDRDSESGSLALRLAAALGFFWYKTGSAGEGATWLQRALAATSDAPPVVRAHALHGLGMLLAERGEPARALVQCEASCELFRREGELAWVARSLNSQGGIARDMGEPDRAEPLFAESAEIRRRLGDDLASLAVVLSNLAMVALDRGDLARARQLGEECLEMSAGADQWIYAVTLQVLADVAVEEGDVGEAGRLLSEALPVLRRLGTYRLVEFLDSCAGLAGVSGKAETTATLIGAADAALDAIGARMVPADARMRERRVAAARDSLGGDKFEMLRREGACTG